MAKYNSTTSRISPDKVQEFLREARERYDFGLEVDKIDREAAQADNAFANASDKEKEQWDEKALKARISAHRPVMQWNRIPTYVAQIANEGRQNRPAIKVAAGDGGEPKTAEFFQSRIRFIEYDSNADTARDTARDQQVTSGRGFIRYSTEFVQGTFRQRIRIEAIENQFSVVWDPSSQEYDRSDADWCFVVERISKDAHERRYGKDSIVSRVDFTDAAATAPGWIGLGDRGELIQIAQYWRKEYKDRTLAEVGTGAPGEMPIPVWEDELDERGFDRKFIVRTRQEQDVTICPYVINGAEILDESEWIGSSIPIVPVWGRTCTVDGRRQTVSLIRNAKDPQRSVNHFVSNIAEQIAMMPKTPYLVAMGQIPAAFLEAWENVSAWPKSYLPYVRFDDAGRDLGAPQRVTHEAPIEALTQGLAQAIDGIKAAMGIFDPSLGQARSAEKSGIAIQRLQKVSSITNFHFADNEARSRKREGQILIELIQKIDRAGMSVPIRDEAGKTTVVPIGKPYADPKSGEPIIHNLTDGDYGIIVMVGPTHASARQEMNDRDSALIQADPELLWVIGDQLFASDDTAGSEERAERMKKAIQMKSPGLIEENQGQGQPLPPQVQAGIQQLQQKLATTQAFAQSLHEQLQTKQPELHNAILLKQMDIDFKREELQADSAATLAKLGIQADIKRLESEIDNINAERQRSHQADLAAGQQSHEQAMQGADQAHDAGQQDSAQGHEAALQDSQQQHQADQGQQDRDAAQQQQEQAQQNQPKPKAA